MHIAIDFGTHGCAMAFAHDGKVIVNDWRSKYYGRVTKMPTLLLLDDNDEVVSFGCDAKYIYLNLSKEAQQNWKLFERFKMALYENDLSYSEDNTIRNKRSISQFLISTNGLKVESGLVFIKALQFLRTTAKRNLIRVRKSNIQDDEIQWILTVPAIWSETAKHKMKEWTIKAGLVDRDITDQCLIVYEPDCAALAMQKEYWANSFKNENSYFLSLYLLNKKRKKRKKREKSKNEESNLNLYEKKADGATHGEFEPGDKYVLVDAGGGTVDIACHQILDDIGVREIVYPTGGIWGSCYIDDLFVKLLQAIFSKEWIDYYREKEPADFLRLIYNFESAKSTFFDDLKAMAHEVALPFDFMCYLHQKCVDIDKDINDVILDFKTRDATNFIQENAETKLIISMDDDSLKLDIKIWKWLFDSQINNITTHVKNLLSLDLLLDCKYLFLTGGFANSKYYQQRMTETFPQLKVFIPNVPTLSVVVGAAYMAMNHNYIRERKLKHTYKMQQVERMWQDAFFDASENNQLDRRKKDDLCGEWDPNLTESIDVYARANERSVFKIIMRNYGESVDHALKVNANYKSKLESTSNNKIIIEQHLKSEEQYKLKQIQMKYMREIEKLKKISKQNNIPSITRERIFYEFYRQKQNLKTMYEFKLKELVNCKDVEQWLCKIEEFDLQTPIKQSVTEMIQTKMQKLSEQIKYAKYLHNSPFADELKAAALKTDHSITEIANSADDMVLVNLLDKYFLSQNDIQDDEKNADQYLHFQLRFDQKYENWNDNMKSQIQSVLSKQLGIAVTCLTFISARNGCIVLNFSALLTELHSAMEQANYISNLEQDLRQTLGQLYNSTPETTKKLRQCVEFVQKRVSKFDKEALYASHKCVTFIVSHCRDDKPGSVLDDNILSTDAKVYKTIMNPKWDRVYGPKKTYWKGSLKDDTDRGEFPYFCPSGWKRYSIRIPEFDNKTKGWSVCYHGTNNEYIGGILSHGTLGATYAPKFVSYFSPSIEYAAHPRYAKPQKLRNGQFVQMVFQCRINTKSPIFRHQPATFGFGNKKHGPDYTTPCVIDKNFTHSSLPKEYKNNKILEFLLENNGYHRGELQYYCYGIMIRIYNSVKELKALSSSHWWKHTGKWKNHDNWENQ